MKILLISSLYGISGGGAGLTVGHLARGLSTRGNEVVIVTLGGSRRWVETEDDGLRVYRFLPLNLYPFSEKDSRPMWQKFFWQSFDVYNLHSANVLRGIMSRESPDIIHIHKMRGFSGAVWQTASRLYPGRVIQTCHDYESMSPDGLLRGSIGAMALGRRWPVRGYQLIRAWLSAGVTVVTAPSAHALQRVTESGLFPRARCEVVPNTHGWRSDELNTIVERVDPQPGGRTNLLFLGRLEKEKGIVELCEAFLQAFDRQPSIRLDIAGWGTMEAELRKAYGHHTAINFLGVINAQMKNEVLSRATAMVVPSLVEEVFGLVAVEAYAFGVPVIASNTGGLASLIRHGETGWQVAPGDVQTLAERITSVAGLDPARWAGMSRTCREYAREFTMEMISNRFLEIYDEMLK